MTKVLRLAEVRRGGFSSNPSLGAFCGYLAVGAVAPDRHPPYKLSRDAIEAAINARGFQLFRLSKKD
jgi:hypothetical protein